MAKSKVTHSRVKRKRDAFPEVKGKIVNRVELMPTENGYSIGIKIEHSSALMLSRSLPYSLSCRTGRRKITGRSNAGQPFGVKAKRGKSLAPLLLLEDVGQYEYAQAGQAKIKRR
jgi:hypothetical protein